MSTIKGEKAPAFQAPDQDGVMHTTEEYLGSWLLLYFYPKDDTPGCTTEACNFRDAFSQFMEKGIVIVGVSTDSPKKHTAFRKKYQLPFTLLADEEKKIVTAYGVWQEKSLYGKKYMGIARTTFLIDPKGIIQNIYENVKPEEHIQTLLQDLQSTQLQ